MTDSNSSRSIRDFEQLDDEAGYSFEQAEEEARCDSEERRPFFGMREGATTDDELPWGLSTPAVFDNKSNTGAQHNEGVTTGWYCYDDNGSSPTGVPSSVSSDETYDDDTFPWTPKTGKGSGETCCCCDCQTTPEWYWGYDDTNLFCIDCLFCPCHYGVESVASSCCDDGSCAIICCEGCLEGCLHCFFGTLFGCGH